MNRMWRGSRLKIFFRKVFAEYRRSYLAAVFAYAAEPAVLMFYCLAGMTGLDELIKWKRYYGYDYGYGYGGYDYGYDCMRSEEKPKPNPEETPSDRNKYTAEAGEARERYGAACGRLWEIIMSDAPDAGEFSRALDEALVGGFPIDWPGRTGSMLLHQAIYSPTSVDAGLPQVLIDAGADVDAQDYWGRTPLSGACEYYISYGGLEYLAVVDALLAKGARPELDEGWKNLVNYLFLSSGAPARHDWLVAYIAAWPARRAAAERSAYPGAVSSFDYAL